MLRRLATSNWTAITLGLTILALHVAWAVWLEPTRRGEIVTGFGASMIVFGLLVAARPFLTTGLEAAVDREASAGPAAVLSGGRTDDPDLLRRRAEARDYIFSERVVAVLVIAGGTLLNGYGSPLVRLFGLEGQSP